MGVTQWCETINHPAGSCGTDGPVRLVNVPVKVYTAVRQKDIHFTQLDEKGDRIRYKRVSEKTGREVDYEDIKKNTDLTVKEIPGLGFSFNFLNTAKEPFNNPAVRRAFSIDALRVDLLDLLLFGG